MCLNNSGLAVEPNDRDAVFGMAEPGSASEEKPRRTITMYRDGFQVDDGPYRRLDDPANAEFLRSLAMGRTPKELLGDGDVTVGLIDKRKEEFVETFSSFSGEGNSLGTSASASPDGLIDPSSLPDTPPPVDDAQPTTSIQVRLVNGQRRVIRINTASTAADLAAHIGGDTPFRLISGFPPKPLTDLSQTIEAAGLKGAQVMQKGP
jgi:UBX domain-containing protein 1